MTLYNHLQPTKPHGSLSCRVSGRLQDEQMFVPRALNEYAWNAVAMIRRGPISPILASVRGRYGAIAALLVLRLTGAMS